MISLHRFRHQAPSETPTEEALVLVEDETPAASLTAIDTAVDISHLYDEDTLYWEGFISQLIDWLTDEVDVTMVEGIVELYSLLMKLLIILMVNCCMLRKSQTWRQNMLSSS